MYEAVSMPACQSDMHHFVPSNPTAWHVCALRRKLRYSYCRNLWTGTPSSATRETRETDAQTHPAAHDSKRSAPPYGHRPCIAKWALACHHGYYPTTLFDKVRSNAVLTAFSPAFEKHQHHVHPTAATPAHL